MATLTRATWSEQREIVLDITDAYPITLDHNGRRRMVRPEQVVIRYSRSASDAPWRVQWHINGRWWLKGGHWSTKRAAYVSNTDLATQALIPAEVLDAITANAPEGDLLLRDLLQRGDLVATADGTPYVIAEPSTNPLWAYAYPSDELPEDHDPSGRWIAVDELTRRAEAIPARTA